MLSKPGPVHPPTPSNPPGNSHLPTLKRKYRLRKLEAFISPTTNILFAKVICATSSTFWWNLSVGFQEIGDGVDFLSNFPTG